MVYQEGTKCETCAVQKRANESEEPVCCAWFMNNVVILGKDVKECNVYEPIND